MSEEIKETSTESAPNKISIPQTIYAGETYTQLMILAYSMRAQDYPENDILELLTSINSTRCESGVTDGELSCYVKEVMKKSSTEAQEEVERLREEDPQGEAPFTSALMALEDIEEQEVEWLVTDVIPRGQITLMCGSGGAGKTFCWCDLAAAISSGKTCLLDPEIPFDESDSSTGRKPAKVLFFSSEDSVGKVLVKRLKACGADMKNISTIPLEDDRFRKIKFDSNELKGLLAEIRPELCIFDPIQAFLPKKTKMSERNEMREALEWLISYGEKYGTTFLIVVHCNKRAGASGKERLADSADIWDIARSVLILGDTEDENGTKYRYISHEKSNYGPRSRTILFDIAPEGRVEFKGTCNKTDYDFVTAKAYAQRSKPAREDATATISNMLLGGPMAVGELDSIILTGGLASKSTLKKAKTDMNRNNEIKFTTCGFGKSKRTYISYPSATKEEIMAKYEEDMKCKNDQKNEGS